MTRDRFDPDLDCTVRRCAVCDEEWPLDGTFYSVNSRGGRLRKCRACQEEAPGVLKGRKHAADSAAKRWKRYDPATRDAILARQREASRRYYWAHREVELERSRAEYAARLDRPVRVGFGRPRTEVAA